MRAGFSEKNPPPLPNVLWLCEDRFYLLRFLPLHQSLPLSLTRCLSLSSPSLNVTLNLSLWKIAWPTLFPVQFGTSGKLNKYWKNHHI